MMDRLHGFYVYCDGGLCNRLNALLGGLELSRNANFGLIVSWPINNWCELSLGDVLDIDGEFALEEWEISELSMRLMEYSLIAHEQQSFDSPPVLNPNLETNLHSLRGKIDRAVREKSVVYFNSVIPPCMRINDISRLARRLKFKAQFLLRAERFLKRVGLTPDRYWALHMRGTDFRRPASYYRWWKFISRCLPGNVLLCTDDVNIKKQFSSIQYLVSRDCGAYPEKYQPELSWTDNILDQEGRSFDFNVRRSSNSVKESIVDLILLSEGHILLTSESSFLGFAILMVCRGRLLGEVGDIRIVRRSK
jgi:hypothetical protein